MAKKNVLHLVEYLYLGGIERILEQIAVKTGEQANLHFFTYETKDLKGIGKKLSDSGFPVHTFKKKSGTDLSLLKELIRVVKENKIDVIHTHDFGPMEYAVLLKLRFPKIKLVHTQHTMHHFIIKWKYRAFYQAASYFYSSIIAVSQFVFDSIRTNCPYAKRSNLKVISNGVDSGSFRTSPDIKLNPNQLNLVSIARISYEKNIEYLLHTCKLLKEANIPFVLHHAGTSKLTETTEKVKSYIFENDLDENIKLHGFVDNALTILNLGDIFLTASKREGHPVALLEAMSCEKLCICSDIAPHREIAKNDLVFFDLNDETALFKILKDQFHSKMNGNEIKNTSEKQKNARKNVVENFSLENVVKNYVAEY